MKKNNLKFFYLTSTIIWMMIIFWESSIGDYSSVPGTQDGHNDLLSSIVHVVSYLILCFLLTKSFIVSGIKNNKAIVYGFIITSLYGITDEIHQYFVPGREMHFSDWLLDTIGALIVFTFYKYKIKK